MVQSKMIFFYVKEDCIYNGVHSKPLSRPDGGVPVVSLGCRESSTAVHCPTRPVCIIARRRRRAA